MNRNQDNFYGVGLDIGGTKVYATVTDSNGVVFYEEKYPSTSDLTQIAEIINQAINSSKIDQSKLKGIGIGVPAVVDPKTGWVKKCAAMSWEDFNLKEALMPYFNVPFSINNDVNCAALGEQWVGTAAQSTDFYFIALGTGVGSAIVTNGQLVYGHQNRAGEIGYNMTPKEVRAGKRSHLDQFGLFESKISGTGLANEGWSGKDVFKHYALKHPTAIRIIDDFIMNLSVFLGNTVNLLNPELVIIGGGVSSSLTPFIPEIQSIVDQISPSKTHIKISSLGERAGVLGACASVLNP